MTRAAAEPQFAAPPAQRLGYLRHIIANLDIASPDGLHGAAHLAPLAGLDLPVLDMLADLNDAAIEAGAAADLDRLERVRRRTRNRLVAEAARLADEILRAPAAPDGSRAEILARLALRGEVMTAEILLVEPHTAAATASRLASFVEKHGAHIPEASRRQVQQAAEALGAGPSDVSVPLRALLDVGGVPPLDER